MTTTELERTPSPAAPMSPLLSVRDLRVLFHTDEGPAGAVNGVSFDLYPNEVLGIVGESGSGKTVASLSIMRLIPEPPGKIADGRILFEDRDLLTLSYEQMRSVRGKKIAMIFQEPMTALNPVFTVGMQVMETVLTHETISRREAFDRAVEMLRRVGIPDAAKRMHDYPHQFSGGMRQRVMIAMALVCHPRILIADEPTTALDVTTQAQILGLMLELKAKATGASIILITHDLAVIAETCQRVIVMYGGRVQEVGTAEQIFYDPKHPYTQGLLASLPASEGKHWVPGAGPTGSPGHSRGYPSAAAGFDSFASQPPAAEGKRKKRLYTIPGNVPSILDLPAGCKFCTRCPEVFDRCRVEEPPLHDLGDGHLVRCHLLEDAVR